MSEHSWENFRVLVSGMEPTVADPNGGEHIHIAWKADLNGTQYSHYIVVPKEKVVEFLETALREILDRYRTVAKS